MVEHGFERPDFYRAAGDRLPQVDEEHRETLGLLGDLLVGRRARQQEQQI
jgi:hypothetical protein